MITLDKNQALKKATSRGYIACKIYEGNHRDPQDLRPFDRFEGDDPKKLQDFLEQFAEDYPFQFCGVFRAGKNQDKKYQEVVNLDFRPATTVEVLPSNPGPLNAPGITKTPQEVEDEIRARIELEMKLKTATEESETKQARLDELETMSGKLASVGYNILMQFMGGGASAPATPGATLQGIDPNELETALAKLVELLGADTIINLANKINPGDPMINMVKNYANG